MTQNQRFSEIIEEDAKNNELKEFFLFISQCAVERHRSPEGAID